MDTSLSRVGDVVRDLDKMAPEVEDLHVTRCVKISSFLFFAKQRSRTQLRVSSRAVLCNASFTQVIGRRHLFNKLRHSKHGHRGWSIYSYRPVSCAHHKPGQWASLYNHRMVEQIP
ncbi:hypothetical protein M752DRAFT_31786 [Aspergillus phoenicis ATCC 13157]|uniref:Uncharacterized protein n=1 Tax=Aspergillus phoenicis ATCC 13157 TaxID=1353007 RepID=A0A370PG31_ASPPH|nr:hypothetical protein M752DRAFT_31786 [Aspergillus phoenicis ATCC 13157]